MSASESEVPLAVAVVREQTCFVNLPLALTKQLASTVVSLVLRIRWHSQSTGTDCEAYVGWGGGPSSSSALEVPASLAEALQLQSGQKIRARAVQVPIAQDVQVEPETMQDWELAQQAAAVLEDTILTQVCRLP